MDTPLLLKLYHPYYHPNSQSGPMGAPESWPFLFQAPFRQQGVMHLRTEHFQAPNVKDPTARQMN